MCVYVCACMCVCVCVCVCIIICVCAGNVINIQTGEWVGKMSGLGAGLDSFFEYLFKVNYHSQQLAPLLDFCTIVHERLSFI